MHFKDIFNVVCSHNLYEYFIINRDFKVTAYSVDAFKYCHCDNSENDIFTLIPELIGMEDELQELFLLDKCKPIKIPHIFKEPDNYVNIIIQSVEKNKCDNKEPNSLIILVQNTTEVILAQQKLMQTANENSLLLKEISDKNAQLYLLNEKMEELVEIEIKKNIEKQKLMEHQSRYSQMGEMVEMIIHQWKQPLNSINVITQSISIAQELGKLDDKYINEKTDAILKQTKYMSQIVDIFQGFFKPNKLKRYFNLYDSIESVLKLLQNEYRLIDINLKLDGNRETIVNGYPSEYIQVVLAIVNYVKDNLILNKHDQMSINIYIYELDGKSIVTIEDNAGGIEKNLLDNIFDISTDVKQENGGIGLSIARDMIVNNMGGKIELENIDGGSKFSIIL